MPSRCTTDDVAAAWSAEKVGGMRLDDGGGGGVCIDHDDAGGMGARTRRGARGRLRRDETGDRRTGGGRS